MWQHLEFPIAFSPTSLKDFGLVGNTLRKEEEKEKEKADFKIK